MEETINFKGLLETLKKRFVMIIVITMTFGLLSGVVSYFFLTPIYQASTQILVNQAKNDQAAYNFNEVQTNLQLINTYNVIMKSPAILDKVSHELKLKMTAAELNEKITVESEKDSQVVNVSVKDSDAKTAAKIANKTAEVFQTEIVKIMNVDNVSILAKATVLENQSPIKPLPLLNIGIALVIGLIIGVGISFILEFLDNTVKNEQEIEKLIGVPVLGVIATMDDSSMKESKNRHTERNSRLRGETIGS